MKIGRVFENGVLREIFGLKRDEVTREWRRPHKEELLVASSSNINLVIKSRGMRWVGHVACMGDRRGVYRVLVRRPEGTNNFQYTGVDGRMILKWIFMKWDEEAWAGLIWLRIGTGGKRV
jgi:hypothetical protein